MQVILYFSLSISLQLVFEKLFAGQLMEFCKSFECLITMEFIETTRKHQQAILLADQGLIINTNNITNLPKQRIQKRKLVGSKTFVQQIFALSTEQVWFCFMTSFNQ